MNPFTNVNQQQPQWSAHPLTLIGSLSEGDVRKGEYTMSKFLEHSRWFTEYGNSYNTKQFLLNLPTTHAAEDLCSYASYDACITGPNKIFYLHEYFKQAAWRRIEETGFATDSTYQIPYRPSPQLRLVHLTRMANVTEAQQDAYNQYYDPDAHPEL